MRKRINVKALAILLAVGAVLCAGAHFLHGYQVRSNAGILLAQADGAEKAGRLDAAIGYLTRYIALAPADSDARVKYALLIAQPARAKTPRALQQAFEALSRTVQLAPDRTDVRRRLIQVAMDNRLQRFTEAGEHIDKLPPDGELLGLRARCYEETGNLTQAREYYEKAITSKPAELDSYVRLAHLLRTKADAVRRAKEDTDQLADQRISAMVTANPKNADAYLIRARYRQQTATPATDRVRLRADVERDLRGAATDTGRRRRHPGGR